MSTEAPRNPDGMTEDELWAQLDGQVGAERAVTLIDLVYMAADRDDFDAALPLADAAVEAAKDSDNEQTLARALTTRGKAHHALEQYPPSAEDHLAAAKLFEKYDSLESTYHAYFHASWSFESAGMFDRSLDCIDIAIASIEQSEDQENIGRAHRQRADVLEKLDRPSAEVLQALSNARQAFREAELVDAVLDADDRAAGVLLDNDDYAGAINLLHDCLYVAETKDEGRAAYYAFRLGRAMRYAGRFVEALEVFKRPYDFYVANDKTGNLGETLLEMAHCNWRLDNDGEAFQLLSRARANADVVGKDETVFDCDVLRAIWLHGLGNYAEAEQLNRLLAEANTGWTRFMARARLADNLYYMERLDAALEACQPEEGDEEFVGHGNWFWRESIRAQVLDAMEQGPRAWEIAERCLAMDMSTASAGTQGRLHELAGDRFHFELDDAKSAHDLWARAVAFYLEAGMTRDARRLSKEFMPRAAEEQVQ